MIGKSARGLRVGRTVAVLVGVAGGMSACKDSGLPDRNLPKAEAERRTYSYPAYQQTPEPAPIWEIGGRRWQPLGSIETIDPALLRAIGNAQGTPVFALATDNEPYSKLYTPVGDNRWRNVAPID